MTTQDESIPKLDPKTDGSSVNIVGQNIEELRQLFPDAFTETSDESGPRWKLDFNALREILGDYTEDQPEPYNFTWNGKSEAWRAAQMQSHGTLRPCPQISTNWNETENLLIEGDSLEVLKLLQRSYHHSVKMIYVDPPYNNGSDAIYPFGLPDTLETYLRYAEADDTERLESSVNSNTSSRYHTNWLNFIYPRLKLARHLLCQDGYLVVSIDDHELKHLQHLLDEIFGEENRLAVLVSDRNRKNDAKFFSVGHDYMLIYAKNKTVLRENGVTLRMPKEGVEELKELFTELRSEHSDDWGKVDWKALRKGIAAHFATYREGDLRLPLKRFNKIDEHGPYRTDGDISWPGGGGPRYDVPHPVTGKPCKVPSRGWVWPTYDRMKEEIDQGKVVFGDDETTIPSRRRNLFEATDQLMRSVSFNYAQKTAQEFAELFEGVRVFDNPRDYRELCRLIEYLTDEDDFVLDLFARSGSTAHAVLYANHKNNSSRRFICVQSKDRLSTRTSTGRNAVAVCDRIGAEPTVFSIAAERIRRAGSIIDPSGGIDVGFRVFRLSESNLTTWSPKGDELEAVSKPVDAYHEASEM